jgi:hypothetical protein
MLMECHSPCCKCLQVIIGCLPTYAQAGIVSPVLLAIMRLIQGLAMGGEFGEHTRD